LYKKKQRVWKKKILSHFSRGKKRLKREIIKPLTMEVDMKTMIEVDKDIKPLILEKRTILSSINKHLDRE